MGAPLGAAPSSAPKPPGSTAAGIRASVLPVGFSLGEIFLLILVGIIVVGPKRLPGMMRTAGQWVARLRRMSTDLRSQSGIDDLLRQEGLDQHLHELRSLSRMNVVDTLMAPAPNRPAPNLPPAREPAATKLDQRPLVRSPAKSEEPLRERERPLVGCDACGALADDAVIYPPVVPVPVPVAPVDAKDRAEAPAEGPEVAP